ncbi:histidine kinase [Streptomyces sp. NPDC050095]|uniref:sensor histidine kinase n=1 Tax=unclassified Streptomyces TaxID=2593676 RepID=UPI0034156317
MVVLAAFAAIYLIAGALPAVAVFVLQLCYVLPALQRFRGPWLLVAQAVAGYVAVLAAGASVGILGFLGGSLLLCRSWWPLLVLPVVGSAMVFGPVDPVISMVLVSLVVYGLIRLTERAEEAEAARVGGVVAAVAEERLLISAELGDGLGRGLAQIGAGARAALARPDRAGEVLAEVTRSARTCLASARAAAAAYRALSLTPELTTARALLTAASIEADVRTGHAEPLGPAGALLAHVLREAVTGVVRRGATRCRIETRAAHSRVWLRVVSDSARSADDESLGDVPARVVEAGGTLTTGLTPEGRYFTEAVLPGAVAKEEEADGGRAYRLSIALLAAVLVGFCVKALLMLDGAQLLPASAGFAVIVYLQLSSVHGRHPYKLGVMALLATLPVFVFGQAWLGAAGFLAGPLLLALPWRMAWPLVGVLVGWVAGMGVELGLAGGLVVNHAVSAVVTGLVMFGLLRQAQIVGDLRRERDRQARAAVVAERLRAARDLHDLLGHSLAAILLKCELARRLPAERARAELADVLAMTERGEADLRAASGGEQVRMRLAAEAESARSVLLAAGIEAKLRLGHVGLPSVAETALSAGVREAVTNVLRHSSAAVCEISTESVSGGTVLRVRNDGVSGPSGRPGSAGIGNLTTRLAALGGTLVAGAADGWYQLEAWLPAVPAAGEVA